MPVCGTAVLDPLDPLDAVLHGAINVRGDMRFLLRQAEMVNVLLGAYTSGVDTSWPKGRPPYEVAEAGNE